jgi:hypothetical protein
MQTIGPLTKQSIIHSLGHLLATLEVLQLMANGIQNQAIVPMRHNLRQKMLIPIFADELVHPGHVISVIPNIGGMQTEWNVGNHMLMKLGINLTLWCDTHQYDPPRVLQEDVFVPLDIVSD